MNDDELAVMMLVMMAMFAYIIRLKWVVRRMKRERTAEEARAAIIPAQHIAHAPAADPEIARLKERLHVLERIAVEKQNSLAREIEGLRER